MSDTNRIFKSLGDDSKNKEFILSNDVTIVKVGHDRCPPCVRISSAVLSCNEEVSLLDLDVAVASKYIPLSMGSFPKWAAVKGGEVIFSASGFGDYAATSNIRKFVELNSGVFHPNAQSLVDYIRDILREE